MTKYRNASALMRNIEHAFRRILRILELIIAAVIVIVLAVSLCADIRDLIAHPETVRDISSFLNTVLNIMIGLEFVRMLIDTTPANIVEVLIVAITRQVILSHGDYWCTIASVACIAGLFATRRFIVPFGKLQEEMVKME